MPRSNPATTHQYAGVAAWNFKLKAEIHSYDDCARFLRETHRDGWHWGGSDRVLGPKMTVRQAMDESYVAVVLYATEIIRYYPDGTFSVDNGGHATPTTSTRLNAVLPRGYHAYHNKRKLSVNGYYPCDHDVKIPVERKVR